MAFEWMAWASKQNIDHSPTKFVLIALANYADHKGVCFPSAKTIQKFTSLSEKTIYRAFKKLEEMGLVEMKRRRRDDGGYSTYEFQFLTSGLSVQLDDDPVDRESRGGPDRESRHNLSDINQSDKKLNKKDFFDRFWEMFPRQRRGGKKNAERAWAAATKRAPPDKILEGLAAYAKSREVAQGYAKGAAAWLNDDRWENNYEEIYERSSNGNKGNKSDRIERAKQQALSDLGVESASRGVCNPMLPDLPSVRE
jgi:DNA-binding transcriptional ArsR family regulator